MLEFVTMRNKNRKLLYWLLAGDVLAVLVVTLIGFITHYGEISGARWLTSFFPILLSWLIVAPFLGAYDPARWGDLRQVWRPALAAAIAAPLAATLRAFWLQAVIVPIFVLVLAVTDALGLLLWRSLWAFITRRIH